MYSLQKDKFQSFRIFAKFVVRKSEFMKKIVIILFLLLPVLTLAQDAGKKKAYYFFGEQCPHCQNVDEYFKANGIYEKYDIMKLEFSNPFNARLLVKFGDVFKSEFKGSVPAVAFGDKFLVGDAPIIENFEKEIANVETKELPDPEKIGRSGDQENGRSQGNQKNYFPAMIGVLVLAVSGALVYVNRKKSQ